MGVPLFAAFLVAIFGALLYFQLWDFEQACKYDAEVHIINEADLAAGALQPMLEKEDLAAAKAFCKQYHRPSLRLSLIAPDGAVITDSDVDENALDNHALRPEIIAAKNATPAVTVRYSSTTEKIMAYYAVSLRTSHGTYVLRSAVANEQTGKMLAMSHYNVLWALLLGAALVCILTGYILIRVRKPLLSLQASLRAISDGKLETEIEIPPHGIVRELAAGVSDMTEQLKARLTEVTGERNEKETILSAMGEGVVLMDSSMRVLRCNSAAAKLLRIREADHPGAGDAVPKAWLELAEKALLSGQSFEKEFSSDLPAGGRTFFVKGNVFKYDRRDFLLLTIMDLTNLRKLESFRSDFIANVSHELKTPLTCIIGATETIKEEQETLSKEMFDRLMDMIFTQSERLNFLVRDILSLAELERKQLDPHKDFMPVDLNALITNTILLCKQKPRAANVEINFSAPEPITCEGDSQLLEQAVGNLINNALKYSNSPVIDVSLLRQKNVVVISVRDYGIGIAKEHQKRIFERFYRVHKERSRQLGGTGLGLAIVKHVAKLHGGEAILESEEGKGCCFRIVLPC